MRNNHLGMGATQTEIDERYGFEPEFEVLARPDGRERVWNLVHTFEKGAYEQEAISFAEDFYAEHPGLAVRVQYENRCGTYNKVYEA